MADNFHDFRLDDPPVEDNNHVDERSRRGIGLAMLGALALVLALVCVDVAVVQGDQTPPPRTVVEHPVVRVSGTTPITNTVYLSVSPAIKPGPDGKLHDAFSITSF